MVDSIELDEAQNLKGLDVGGTPANVLEKGKLGFLLDSGIKPEQLVIVVDPFDLSRIERSLILGNEGGVKRFKFSAEVPGSEKTSSEYARSPLKDDVMLLFQGNRGKILDSFYRKHQIFKPDAKKIISVRYDSLQAQVTECASKSKNLRDFMNSLIGTLSPVPVKLTYLESVLAENKTTVYDVLKQRDIEARVFCPGCGKITPYVFSQARIEEKVCCSTANEIIEKGSFVPEEGMLPTLLYLSGITPCLGKDSSYGAKAIDILKSLGRFDRPFVMYSGSPKETMFEYYLLKKN